MDEFQRVKGYLHAENPKEPYGHQYTPPFYPLGGSGQSQVETRLIYTNHIHQTPFYAGAEGLGGIAAKVRWS